MEVNEEINVLHLANDISVLAGNKEYLHISLDTNASRRENMANVCLNRKKWEVKSFTYLASTITWDRNYTAE